MTVNEPPIRLVRADGGYGYVVLVGYFMLNCLLGLLKCNGILLVYIHDEYQTSYSAASAIPVLQKIVESSTSLIFVFLSERFGQRPFIVAGGCVLTIAAFASGFVHNVSLLVLTYGFLIGLGVPMVTGPILQMLPMYFEKKLPMASCIVITGGPIGGLFFPFVVTECIRSLGLKGTFLISAGIFLQIPITGMVMRPAVTPKQTRFINQAEIDQNRVTYRNSRSLKSVFLRYKCVVSSPRIIIYLLGCVAFSIPIIMWNSFQQAHVRDRNVAVSGTFLATLAGVSSVVEIFARPCLGALMQANSVHKWLLPYRFQQIGALGMAALMCSYVWINDEILWLIYAGAMACMNSFILAPLFTVTAHLVGIEHVSAMMSFLCVPFGISVLATQIFGIVRDRLDNFDAILWCCSITSVISAMLIEIVAYIESRSLLQPFFNRFKKANIVGDVALNG